jgi:hypothetical protein
MRNYANFYRLKIGSSSLFIYSIFNHKLRMSIIRKTIKLIYFFIDKILTTITLILIKLYQLTISPDKWIFSPILKDRVCSHTPHCSEYATQILKRYGFCRGLAPIVDRVLSCKPSNKKMYDPAFYRVVFFSSANIWIPFLEELNW